MGNRCGLMNIEFGWCAKGGRGVRVALLGDDRVPGGKALFDQGACCSGILGMSGSEFAS